MPDVFMRVFGDKGIIHATTHRAAVIEREVAALIQHYGQILNSRIKAKASGRPGPNAPTGDYRRSWTLLFTFSGGTATAINGTNEPQGRRLEFGFVGMDSLGRNYNQPPYEHVGPALDEVEPELVDAGQRLVRSI